MGHVDAYYLTLISTSSILDTTLYFSRISLAAILSSGFESILCCLAPFDPLS